MSRFNKWLPFFEESSEKRDVASWDKPLQESLSGKGIQVIGTVSDRAKALVKLGEEEYLDACSMPDLFHLQQDMGKLAGLQIGKRHQQAQQEKLAIAAKSGIEKKEIAAIKKSAKKVETVYEAYRNHSATINKIIHPFNESNDWSDVEQISKSLTQTVCQVSKLAEQLDINVDLYKASKVLNQVPDIIKGISNWISRSQTKIKGWLEDQIINEVEQIWVTNYLLPFLYWQAQLSRTKNGRSNPPLVEYYEQRKQQAKKDTLKQMEILNIPIDRQDILFQRASQMANSFQRASSQVEGRNGYLAFIHHSQKGIPKQKRKALTVVHNFDTKREDGSTPAQRLFNREFPDLFEFLCLNVTGFKEPRKRKSKKLKINILQP